MFTKNNEKTITVAGKQLKKRNCNVDMRLVPYGAGWIDVYLKYESLDLYFVISSAMGDNFDDLMATLYHLYPEQNDYEELYSMDIKEGICECDETGTYKVVEIVDLDDRPDGFYVAQEIPWKNEFCWNEEPSTSRWIIERTPDTSTEFMINIKITIDRDEIEEYEMNVPYKDMCYAVSKACTEALKANGFLGYHRSVYTEDMNVRYLLFLKAYALDCLELFDFIDNGEGKGESSCFEDEIKLLMFDM